MLFLGTFLSADVMTPVCTPTAHSTLTKVTLKNGKYKKLYITQDKNEKINSTFPKEWDFNTIFYAEYDNKSTNAGNINWDLKKISHILIKRREIGKFHWTTIAVKPVKTKEDYQLLGTDYTNAAKTEYEYALVPSFYGIEGFYDKVKIYSDFDDIFIVGQYGIIHTNLCDGFCDVTLNIPSNAITTIHNKYPSIIRNTQAKYITGNFSANFIEYNSIISDYITDDKNITEYQKEIMNFLSDGTGKLFKHFDSRLYLIDINDGITNNADGNYKLRTISFNFTEIGDSESLEDLYNNSLTDVTEEWW